MPVVGVTLTDDPLYAPQSRGSTMKKTLLVVAFVLAYALVVIQTQAYVGPLPARMLIELFALAVIAYWWFSQPREAVAQHSAWLQAHPFFLELGLIALAVTNVVEVQAQWRPLTWSLVALCLLVPPAV